MSDSNFPTSKVTVALGSSVGATATSAAANPNLAPSFFPTTFDGWMSVAASTLALIYTGYQFWKHEWRPWCVARGWLK